MTRSQATPCSSQLIWCEGRIAELERELAETQAREKMLREALEFTRYLYAEEPTATSGSRFDHGPDISKADIRKAQAALAQPTNDTALNNLLAEGQAREKVLREFIGNAQVSSGVCCCGDGMEQHASVMICGHSPVDQWDWSVHCLLAEPLDDTALRAALKAERERVAEHFESRSYLGSGHQLAVEIRALEDE